MSIDLREIQGIVISAYPRSPAARFVLFEVEDAAAARTGLVRLADRVTYADEVDQLIRTRKQRRQEPRTDLNIVFTQPGLVALGVPDDRLSDFSREFREGMVTPHRQRILGDLDGSESDPQRWSWGGPRNPPVHGALLVYGENEPLLDSYVDEVLSELSGTHIVRTLSTVSLADSREHFGFRDGIANPWVDGLQRPRAPRDELAAGEILLGHPDLTGAPEPGPTLGRDGSYLVMRQLVQDVEGLWSALRAGVGDADAVRWAAKMAGRWPDGTPLMRSPDEPAGDPSDDFTYRDDPAGLRCPLGAHVRRTNPRDGIGPSADGSIDLVKRHRLLRRGRSFGLPAAAETWPTGIPPVTLAGGSPAESDDRGLIFACLGASLARQFEFVQQTWLNNPKLAGLSENDPVAGQLAPTMSGSAAFTFTAPGPVVNGRIPLPEKYVRCIGGAYFFLPGRTGLATIAGGPAT
jgi:Dyp-type peroxidase family